MRSTSSVGVSVVQLCRRCLGWAFAVMNRAEKDLACGVALAVIVVGGIVAIPWLFRVMALSQNAAYAIH